MVKAHKIIRRLNAAAVNDNEPSIWQLHCNSAAPDRFVIQPATDSCSLMQAAYIREEVFRREWNLQIPPIASVGTDKTLTP
jgi:hypothetical protein